MKKNIKEYVQLLDNNPIILLGMKVTVGLIILIILALLITNPWSLKRGEQTRYHIVEGKNNVIHEDIKVGDIIDVKEQDEILDIIDSGLCGEYVIGNKTYVILSSGSNPIASLSYVITSDIYGNRVVEYEIVNREDILLDKLVKYVILEFDEPGVIVREKYLPINYSELSGLINVIIWEDRDTKYVYDVKHNRLISNVMVLEVPGIYALDLDHGFVSNSSRLRKVKVEGIVVNNARRQEHQYIVSLANRVNIRVYSDNMNLSVDKKYDITLTYNISEGRFIGEFKEKK